MKTVIIINNTLSPGLAANTAAVLGISIGHTAPGVIGPDLADQSGAIHPGITRENIPVLATGTSKLKDLYHQGSQTPEVSVIDFNSIAQKCRDYSDYSQKLAAIPTQDLIFSGICLRGPKKIVNTLTGSLKLYR
ncbi:MAG: DUF2000 domain-containing protein [Desulfobacterales bacterium]|nr:DUF2000 domain-containing protein [Desulfobacterales bacterium]